MVKGKSRKNKSRKNNKTIKSFFKSMGMKQKKRLLKTIKKINIFKNKKSKRVKKRKNKKSRRKVMKGGAVPFGEVGNLPGMAIFGGHSAMSYINPNPAEANPNIPEPVNPSPMVNPHIDVGSNEVTGPELGKILTEYNG